MKHHRKNTLFFFVGLFLFLMGKSMFCNAQERTVERIYIATDRETYLAGESVWLSLYCFDNTDKANIRLSNLSSVAYLELHSATGMSLTAKIAIKNGRGSGKLELPLSLITSNYRLIAYTKQMLNEDTLRYFDKIIAIYNTLSTERSTENVIFKEEITSLNDNNTKKNPFTSPSLNVKLGNKNNIFSKNTILPLSITNNGNMPMFLNMAIAKIDIEIGPKVSMSDYLTKMKAGNRNIKFSNNYIPEYEGEIIRGRIPNIDLSTTDFKTVFLSSPGKGTDIYTSTIDKATGDITFYTASIYGTREIVLEYPYYDKANGNLTFELLNPFVRPQIDTIPKLILNKNYAENLVSRSIEMQLDKKFGIDTLFESIAVKNDPLLYGKPIIYPLDNYTRFPDMQEIMIEFIAEMRVRKMDGKPMLQIGTSNDIGPLSYSIQNPLLLLDGIPIFNHEELLKYDPLKVKSISIYNNGAFLIGKNRYEGLAKFDTYKGDYSGFSFNKGVKIMDFQGVQYPCKFTGEKLYVQKDIPDIRTLLHWEPQITINQKGSTTVNVYTSSIPGKYSLIIEGVTLDGEPIYHYSEFIIQ